MNRTCLLAAATLVLGAGACSYSDTTTTRAVVATAPVSSSEQACFDYGFTPGSAIYDRCVQRQLEVRAMGRVPSTYVEAQLLADARSTCYSYGLDPTWPAYGRCLSREVDARRYQEAYVAPPAIVYPVASYPAPAPYVEPRVADTTGIQAFRDEYGFRYDAEGNRLDRNGNMISPQSTRP